MGQVCAVSGCLQPRDVARSGFIYARCVTHRRALVAECSHRYHQRHRDLMASRQRRWRAEHPGYDAAVHRRAKEREPGRAAAMFRDWEQAHREERTDYHRAWRNAHPESARESSIAKANRRREAPFVWLSMDPWPTDCQVCYQPIDPGLRHGPGGQRDPMAGVYGHEPPIAWMLRHPDYDGLLVLRPEHWLCNAKKHARPDWELDPPKIAVDTARPIR